MTRNTPRPNRPLRMAIHGLLSTVLLASCHPLPDREELAAPPGPPPGLEYMPPTPGTYELPPIQTAPDGWVLDADGSRRRLWDYFDDRLVLLSFVYTRCHDGRGCPLATAVFQIVAPELIENSDLRDQVRLVTLSFDPEKDTPETMRHYVARDGYLEAPWRERAWSLLTTPSRDDLAPILDGFGQYIVREKAEDGSYTGQFTHVLKVFLIDRQKRVRNVYSTSFLHPALAIGDLETLLLEEKAADEAALARLAEPPLGLPAPSFPEDNGPTVEKVRLGRKLFLDRRLSDNGTLSCAMCHVPEQGFASNDSRTAVGREGRSLRRNAPSLYNVAYVADLFHDGREPMLDLQAFDVFLNRDEMGARSLGEVVARVRALDDYRRPFERAFGGPATVERIGQALGTYMRSLLSADSPFDRWYYGGDAGALSAAARRGFALFTGEAGCARCHQVAESWALFTDGQFHDTGIGRRRSADDARAEGVRLELAPGRYARLDGPAVRSVGERPADDLGRYEATAAPADRWAFRTPSLRNVALTAPYMHDGSLSSLAEVIDFYNRGGHDHDGLDPRIRPLGLDRSDREALVAFLESLTGDNVDALVADARGERVGNPGG